MIANVRRLVRDRDPGCEWQNGEIEAALAEGANMFWTDLLETPANRCLKAVSEGEPLVAGQDAYPLPEDCLRVAGIQIRPWASAEWMDLTLDRPRRTGVRRGSEALAGVTCGLDGGLCWWPEADEADMVLIHPPLALVTSEEFRFRYWRLPVFPFAESGTLRAPDGEATETYPSVPLLSDQAVEYLAAALLSGEECEERQSDTYFLGMYHTTLTRIAQSSGRVYKAPRRYVRRVSGRP
jgi:hypothetical protein